MIGPTFGTELHAAGLGGLGIWWDADGTVGGREGLTTEQNDTLDAVIAAHDPEQEPPAASTPQLVAAAMRVVVGAGEITSLDGPFNLVAGLYLDAGTFMLLFLEPQLDAEYFAQPLGGAPAMAVTEQAAEYFIIEARDAIGGALVDPSSFGVLVYR